MLAQSSCYRDHDDGRHDHHDQSVWEWTGEGEEEKGAKQAESCSPCRQALFPSGPVLGAGGSEGQRVSQGQQGKTYLLEET